MGASQRVANTKPAMLHIRRETRLTCVSHRFFKKIMNQLGVALFGCRLDIGFRFIIDG